jgi:hypothetical protein
MRDFFGSHCGDALYQGTTSQAAEKLGFKVGRGFIPGLPHQINVGFSP